MHPTDRSTKRPLLAVEANTEEVHRALREALEGGPAVLPLDPRLPPRARGALVADLQPTAITKPGGIVALPGGREVPGDVVAVIPTSGSTGAPKGVMLTGAGIEASVRAGLDRTDADPSVPWLCCLPTSHVAGLLVLARALLIGTEPILHEGFDTDAILATPPPFHFAVVPTMLRRLLAAGLDTSRLGSVLVGGARVPEELRVAGVTATYGMTETTGGCVYDGWPLAGTEVTTTADGRLRIAGPTVMAGYRHRDLPDRGAGVDPDGAFTTNDLGAVEADGLVRVFGRGDDVIVTGGEKVVVEEVESRLERHPAVAEAAVVGVADEEWGQRAVAVVVPAQVGAVLSLSILRSFVAEEMPRYAAPRDLVVVNTLPRLPSGKVDRHALRSSLAR